MRSTHGRSELWPQATLGDLRLAGVHPLGSVPGPSLLSLLPSPAVYVILGRVSLLSAVVLSFLTTFIMVSFASQLFPRTRKHNFVSAFISFLTGPCAFLALLLHTLEIQSLRMKPSPPSVLHTVASLHPGLQHPSVHGGWCHLPHPRNSLP